jgi:hypothetical protein
VPIKIALVETKLIGPVKISAPLLLSLASAIVLALAAAVAAAFAFVLAVLAVP